jgi:Protein of unknown function (DUF2778)
MWVYSQASGHLFAADGLIFARGYAGHGEGLNNPAKEAEHAIGPLPRGRYTIAAARTSDRLGPVVMNLDPDPANEMFGRSLFRIHGDNAAMNRSASDGCIVLARGFRDEIAASDDRDLLVVATEADAAACFAGGGNGA